MMQFARDDPTLFGSRAWRDARSGSDYAIAVILKDMPPGMHEHDRRAGMGTPSLDETGHIFEEWPLPADYT